MLLETFWYQIFENRTKTELSRHDNLNYLCKCIPTFALSPCIYIYTYIFIYTSIYIYIYILSYPRGLQPI